jgi:surfactin synthase thioesterase subunit
MTTAYQTPWLHTGPASPGAPRLLCVPYSAKGASLFRDWPRLLGPGAEVGSLQLPGREDRLTEKPFDRVDDLLAELVPAILPWVRTDAPFVLFGHCMGALVGSELAMALRREHQVQPDAIVLSGGIPAWQDTTPYDLSGLTDAELVRNMRQRGALSPQVLAEPALLALMLPAARADAALCEDIRRRGRPGRATLDGPLTLYAARDDPRFGPEEMRGWEALTGQPATLRIFDGDHDFLDDDQETVVDALRAILAVVAAPS